MVIVINRLRPPWKTIKDYVMVGLLGLLCLVIAYQLGYLGLSWYDEIIYAVVARNIVTEQSLNTNHYLTEAILKTGFPARDVHMPGHMLLMAGSFALFGFTDAAAVLPSQVSYVVAGVVLFETGRRLFDRRVGWIAAIFFFAYPINFVFANTAMGELPLTLLVVMYLWLWVKVSQSPHRPDAFWMAFTLAIGTIYRETFLIFLLPSLYLVWQWSRKSRSWQPMWVFSASFAILAIGLIYPLAQRRSYFYNNLNLLLEAKGGWEMIIWTLISSTLNSVTNHEVITLGFFEGLPEFLINLFHLLLGLISFGGLYFFDGARQRFVWLFIFIFWGTIFVLNSIYIIPVRWDAIRSLAILMPAGLLILAALTVKLKHSPGWILASIVVLAYLGYASFLSHNHWQNWRQDFLTTQQENSRIIYKYLGHLEPKVILSHRPFLYAWEHYPTIVIHSFPDNLNQATALFQSITVDAIVFDEKFNRDVSSVVSELDLPYTLLFPHPVEGYYFLVLSDPVEQH